MNKIDWNFISELEGRGANIGYVPTNNSGVTIATGFDLKEKDEEFLLSIGISETIVSKLQNFCGLSGDKAKAVAQDLALKDDEVEEIDLCSKKHYATKIMNQYNSRNPKETFTNLTKGQQTVIASVGFQYGSFSRTPTFIKHAVNGDWKLMEKELRNFNDDFHTRRLKEADYLWAK